MKPLPLRSVRQFFFVKHLGLVMSAGLMAPAFQAAEIQKADNADALQNASSWVGGVQPGSGDIVVFSQTAGSLGLDVNLTTTTTWGGLKITDIEGPLTIRLTAQLNFNTTTSTFGIDMSEATADVLVTSSNSAVVNWDPVPANLITTIAEGRTLTMDLKFGATDRAEKRGLGTLRLTGSNDNGGFLLDLYEGTVVLEKASSASFHALGGGTHNIYGGTLKLGGTGGDQLYMSSIVNMTEGVFDLNDRQEAIQRLVGTGGVVTNSGTSLGELIVDENSTSSYTYAGQFLDGTGKMSFVKAGTHTLNLTSNTNTHSGGTTVDGGRLNVAGDGTLGDSSGHLILKNGGGLGRVTGTDTAMEMYREIHLDGGIGILRAGYGVNITAHGKITGVGGLRIENDTGTVILTNSSNDYQGETIIGGTGYQGTARLNVSGNQALGAAAPLIFDAGGALGTGNVGTLNLMGTTQTVSSLETLSGRGVISSADSTSTTIANAKLIVNGSEDTIYYGHFGNSIRLEHTGTGTLTLKGPNDNSGFMVTVNQGKVILAKDSSSSIHALGGGSQTINNGGTLELGGTGNDQIYFGATVQVNSGGVFDFAGVEYEDVNYVTGNGTVTNSGASGTSKLVLGSNVTSSTTVSTFGGVIQDGATAKMALEKNGTHVLVMNGTSTFTGGTVVNSGVLGGNGKVGAGTLTVKSGAVLSPGATTSSLTDLGAGTLSVDGAVTLEAGSTFRVNVGSTQAATDKLKLMGALNLTGSSLDLIWSGDSGSIFQGTYSSSNMFWITEGATSVSGAFSNFSSVADWGHFDGTEYATAMFQGQLFALFYHARSGLYGPTGLSGGNDLLLIALVPEPSRAVLLLVGVCLILGRRRR